MNYPPQEKHRQQRIVVSVDHASMTASTLLDVFTPANPFVVTRAVYSNETGLAEDATNFFALRLANASAALVVADTTFTAANATEIFTATAHGLLTGDGPIQVSNSGGGLPTGLSAATDYWVIKINANTFYLATSFANAIVGTNLSITGDGTGTQTLSDTASTRRPRTIADGVSTDSAGAGTNTLAVGDTVMTLNTTASYRLLEASERLVAIFAEGGTATLPAGRIVVEGYYL